MQKREIGDVSSEDGSYNKDASIPLHSNEEGGDKLSGGRLQITNYTKVMYKKEKQKQQSQK